jgi:1-acyl-sn-glycerol-3-phosphate acyltransferase
MSLRLVFSLLWTIPASLSTTAAMITFSFAVLPFTSREWQMAWFRRWARAMLRICGVKVRVAGGDSLVDGQNYIFASNHVSLIDSPTIVAFVPRPLCFVAKRELFSVPFMGWYLARQGHIPIDRGEPKAALRSMTEAARVIQAEKKSILIFPEGTRSKDGKPLPFKEGVAMLAIRSGTPIVPVGVSGTQAVMPSKALKITPGPVTLRIGDPIDTSAYDVRQRGELTARLETEVRHLSSGGTLP